jgi:hypothetical protein
MGCGCGKKVRKPTLGTTTVARTTSTTTRTEAAKTFQSGTMRTAPTGPVSSGRKTV